MTLREFYGWAPTETHRDVDGNVVGTVTHDPRFDDAEREAWIAKWEFDQETCPDCGQQRSVCSDPAADYYPQRRICWASAASEVVHRHWSKLHDDDKPDSAGYLPADGVSLWVSPYDLSPGDDFLSAPGGLQQAASNPNEPGDD